MNNLYFQFYYLLAGAWRRRYTIFIPMLILPIFAVLMSQLSDKKYTAHTSMLLQETAKLNPFLEDLAVSAMLKERINSLKILLHSRHILGSVALQQGLITAQSTPQKHDQVINELSNALTINMVGKDLIRIDYRADDPKGMKSMLEVVSDHFIEQVLAPERSSMTDSSAFLAEHLKNRQLELDKAETAMARFKDKYAEELPELYLTNVNRLAQMKQGLAEKQAELAGASRSLGSINQQLSKTNPVLSLIEQNIVRLQGEISLLRARYTEQHSKVITAKRKLQRLEQERQQLLGTTDEAINIDKLWAIGSNYQSSNDPKKQPLLITQLQTMQKTSGKVEGLQEEVNSLMVMIKLLEQQLSGYGANASELSRLQREVAVKRDLYDDMLLRFEKANITASLSVFEQDKRIKIIDSPFTPSSPSNPPLILFIISGVLGGLFLGVSLALIQELSDTSIYRRSQLEELTEIPVLTRIPYVALATRNGDIS
ncbi:GumC family protein [Psychromonas sp. Urea-02u-13]|uniref:GumC family protein n=1 Tax=Psychromonas sp. Urea-02u-13 TaxID=2058326 RepID=UPI000C332CEB|nr:GNVR domain-containing protein [Psychromonas sp. Urea-02u-13]PKG37911.1 chain-length determining protein [Psychromonas sp. Urea-02u-13]